MQHHQGEDHALHAQGDHLDLHGQNDPRSYRQNHLCQNAVRLCRLCDHQDHPDLRERELISFGRDGHHRAWPPRGARVSVLDQTGSYAQTTQGFVPASHLLPLGTYLTDPVAVAETFLHSPYLWGGNSRAGLDCSGLAQIVHHACGITLPGDADLQEAAGLVVQGEFQRGDLLFWKGHIALAVDSERLIHANGHTMSVAYEGIAEAIDRIEQAEGAPLRSHRRL